MLYLPVIIVKCLIRTTSVLRLQIKYNRILIYLNGLKQDRIKYH